MKNTLLVALVISVFAQVAVLPESNAQAVVQASRLARLGKWIKTEFSDNKFVRTLTVAGVVGPPVFWVTHEIGMPRFIKSMCSLEAKTSGRKTLMPKEEACNLYYGDKRFNSCKVDNNNVSLMFPTQQKGVSIRFVGVFRDRKLERVNQSYVAFTNDKQKGFQLIGLPVEMLYDSTERASELRPYPGTPAITKATIQSEDEADAFQFYEEVGAIMRLAQDECSEGKYEKMLEEITKRHGKAKPSVGVKP